jgi:protein phosphatase
MREALLGDRYLLCSDGLSDVVTDQTVHQTLVTCPDPDQAVKQLIDLAIRGGGPDNITCIVADVVDIVTGPVPPSDATVLAGAAANGDGKPRPRNDSPAARAHLLTREPAHAARPAAPAPAEPADGYHHDDDYDADEGGGTGHRRWPVVTSVLVVLVLLIAGGGYAAWRISQSQYYVGSDGKQVVIYRGVNETVAGLTLSSSYLRTGIPISHVQGSLLALPTSSSSLTEAQRTVQNIRRDYTCKQASAAVAKWTANKPKPPVIAKNHKPDKQQKAAEAKVKNYPAKPTVPAYCAAQGAG